MGRYPDVRRLAANKNSPVRSCSPDCKPLPSGLEIGLSSAPLRATVDQVTIKILQNSIIVITYRHNYRLPKIFVVNIYWTVRRH